MRYRKLFILLFLAVPFLAAQSPSVQDLIAEADHLSSVTFENQKALDKLLQAEKMDKNNFGVQWRISRSYVDIGEHLPGTTDAEKEKQLQYYQKALEYADKAVKSSPDSATGYLRRAIANGRVALFKGVWSAIDYVKQVKADCEKAIALDPNNSSAYYVLGRTHAKLCEKSKMIRWPLGLGWANMDESLRYYDRSIQLRPNFILFRLDAARAYHAADNTAKAKELLISIAPMAKVDEDDDQYKKEARELLEKIK
ncbi:MAG: tetratricopeptide repeat protein [Bacteroidetes bacterium]|nr:tetratricopeptide repeat protein [Bacteroidota bacterium]